MQYRVKAMLWAGLGLLTAQAWSAAPAAKPAAKPVETPAAVVPAAIAAPAPAAASSADDAFKFFLQEAQVVTASRRAQKKSDSPVAIDVITREEIEASGARNIQDLLRFRVGVDVEEGNSIEGNPAQVNIRGLPEEFSQSIQVLIDGRSLVSMQNSGVYWRRLPVSIDEIERIEIVRGPNSALFGANSGQGVINIITIKPGNANAYKVELGTLGQRKAHLGLDSGVGTGFAVRGSYDTRANSSSFTPQNEQPASGNKTDDDTKVALRLVGPLWDGADVDFSAGHMNIVYSYPVALGVGGDTGANNDYEAVKLNQALSDDLHLETSFWRRGEETQATLGGAKETIYDLDVLLRIAGLDGRSQTVLGVSGREGQVVAAGLFSDTSAGSTLYAYTRSDSEVQREQHQRRAYASEQLAITDQVSLALAGSFENSDTGGQQPAYQGAIIYKPLDETTLRVSGSKSPTMPSLLNKYARLELITGFNFPDYSVVRVEGSNITAPQIASYEATLSQSFLERRFTAEVTGFQMEISGYPEFTDQGAFSFPAVFGPIPFPPFITLYAPGKVGYITYYRNTYDLVARGLETQLTFKPWVGTRLQLNHTYEDVQSNLASTRYSYTTPWNKVNAIASTDLGLGFHVAGAVGWQGQHYANQISKGLSIFVPDQAKIDARVGYTPTKNIEIYAVGTNLDHQLRTESPDGLTSTQSYAGGLNIAFGGSRQ